MIDDLAVSLPPGLLRDMHATGLLGWGDVHVAQKVSFLYDERDQQVQLALALAVRALRAGLVCLDLAEVSHQTFQSDEEAVAVPAELWPSLTPWRAAIEASPLVTRPGGIPARRQPFTDPSRRVRVSVRDLARESA